MVSLLWEGRQQTRITPSPAQAFERACGKTIELNLWVNLPLNVCGSARHQKKNGRAFRSEEVFKHERAANTFSLEYP
jgi:hypothetical protein